MAAENWNLDALLPCARAAAFHYGLNMSDFALFRLPDGRAWLGDGPFVPLAHPPAEGGVFYINDFDLSDPQPWKKPARLRPVTAADLDQIVGQTSSASPVITWAKPATEWFKMAFRRIRREVLAKRLEKMVPVLTEHGAMISGTPLQLLDRVMTAPSNTWGYAWVQGDHGFLGATPELLFRNHGRQVETMALAGTAKPGAKEDFLTDVKEIDEHEIVVRYIQERLAPLGTVEREPRGLCHASGLVHFQSALRVTLREPVSPDRLVIQLHPTPAVGCLPRDETWLAKLRDYRKQLKVPGFFGAPFGFIEPRESNAPSALLQSDSVCHMIVAIRGIAWQGSHVKLPSGCGIVSGSAFDHEWRELRLKREAVLNLLGL